MVTPEDTIRCRANLTEACQRGKPSKYENPDGWREDGTYDKATDTIICTPCYMAVGQPLRQEMNDVVNEERRVRGLDG